MSYDKLASAGIGGLAGGVVSYGANLFYFRKRTRDDVFELTHDLYGDLTVYWLSPGQDRDLEKRIVKSITKVMSKARAYGSLYLSQSDNQELDKNLINLHKISTGGDFAGADRDPDDERVERCDRVLKNLRESLNKSWFLGTLRRLRYLGR